MDIIDVLERFYYIAESLLGISGAVFFLYRGLKQTNNSLFHYLLAGFYACVFMSTAFYLITWFIADYPYIFSPGDISWIGAIFFLITADMVISGTITAEHRKAAQKFRLPALIAPVVCLGFNVVYIVIYPQIFFNYLLHCIPTAVLSWLALYLFLAERITKTPMRAFHLAALAWIASLLFADLMSTMGNYGLLYIVCCYLTLLSALTMLICCITGKGAAA